MNRNQPTVDSRETLTGRTGARGVNSVVVIAASMGGIPALRRLLKQLRPDFDAPILIVQHISHKGSVLQAILSRIAPHPVKWAEEGELIHSRAVYLAPPDHHLIVESGGVLHLSHEPRVHFLRPAADLLFASAAKAFGRGTTAVVLSGFDGDAADGVRAIKAAGGKVIVQDPATCEEGTMPQHCIDTGCVNSILRLDDIAAELNGTREGFASF